MARIAKRFNFTIFLTQMESDKNQQKLTLREITVQAIRAMNAMVE
jgi:hypothetical protein